MWAHVCSLSERIGGRLTRLGAQSRAGQVGGGGWERDEAGPLVS